MKMKMLNSLLTMRSIIDYDSIASLVDSFDLGDLVHFEHQVSKNFLIFLLGLFYTYKIPEISQLVHLWALVWSGHGQALEGWHHRMHRSIGFERYFIIFVNFWRLDLFGENFIKNGWVWLGLFHRGKSKDMVFD